MRLIDGDALMERLGIAYDCSECDQNESPYCTWKPDVVDVCQIISDAPTIEPEQRWIPCSERLPDTNRDVLLQFSNSMGVGFWEHNSWGINTGDNIYSEIGEREAQPIAWRELPEPYGGEQDD